MSVGRVAIVGVGPSLEEGRWPARAVVGEAVPLVATVFREGHGAVAATVIITLPDESVTASTMPYVEPGISLFREHFTPAVEGNYTFRIEGWADPIATWMQEAEVRLPARMDVALVLAEGAAVLRRALEEVDRPARQRDALTAAIEILEDTSPDPDTCLDLAMSPAVRAALAETPLRDVVSSSKEYPLKVERERALFSAWYEMFPRSEGASYDASTGRWTSGTFATAAKRLPAIARMGFDIVYLPPIHPIGTSYRKGPDNSLTASPIDPGSPYAIGSPAGGHDAIHPDLGDLDDFRAFITSARKCGLEVALDFALQCSPDHPWVTEHPSWFTTRIDGSIAYAENPPKKYHDIYPLNFDHDPEGILEEARRVLEVWIDAGVTAFRVDNPHTKPLPFWERLLADVAAVHPEVLFLAEAFTHPPMMQTLAKIGFHQSMSYFTWRPTATELGTFLVEISGEAANFFRPNLWPTTPDILTPDMQSGGAPIFAARAVAAATGSPSWGIYSGYELVEDAARPDAEEQLHNEKYEYRPRNWRLAKTLGIESLLTTLNATRRAHPALQRLRGLTVHQSDNPAVLCYSRHVGADLSPTGMADSIIVALSLDPADTQEAEILLDPTVLGLDERTPIPVTDVLTGKDLLWGSEFRVTLGPPEAMAIVAVVDHGRSIRQPRGSLHG